MKVGYSDFVKLCRINDPEDWVPGLSVRADGVYVKVPPDGLTYGERAVLSTHPSGNLDEPALRFPCGLQELRDFVEKTGAYGCIDPFDMAEWVIERRSVEASLPSARDHVSDKLAKLNQASTKFWGNADPNDRGTHPDNARVAAWLEDQGFSSTLADKATTIIRPQWAPTGRKPKE